MKTIHIDMDIPEGISRDVEKALPQKVKESTVLALFQEGALTIRQAASLLGMGYVEFTEFLAFKAIPLGSGKLNWKSIQSYLGKNPASHS